MKVALRIRNFDTVLVEFVPDMQQYVAFHISDAIMRIRDPEPDFEVDGIIAKSSDQRLWGRVLQDPRRFPGKAATVDD